MKKFKPLLHSIGTMVILFVGSSCTSDMYGAGPSTQRGSVTGGLTGAALGAIVGNQSGRPLEGAALGGLIGAAAGSALGNAKDQEEGYMPQKSYRYIPSPNVLYNDYQTYRTGPPRRYCPPPHRGSFYFSYRN